MRVVGADSTFEVTDYLVGLAANVLEEVPAFWGRYFTSPEEQGVAEYRHRVENPVLNPGGIRVVPIGRPTNDVGGGDVEGEADGLANGSDLIATFGEAYLVQQGAEFLVFLDVSVPHLSSDYYTGWVRGLGYSSGRVRFLPGVFGLQEDGVTWDQLKIAMANGVACAGLWTALPLANAVEPVPWDPKLATPNPDPRAPVLLWQYMVAHGVARFDRDLVNPGINAQLQLLRRLILPPAV
jgi:hypothetical protein